MNASIPFCDNCMNASILFCDNYIKYMNTVTTI